MTKIIVQEKEITVVTIEDKDYISLTDMANAKESESRAADIIKNWLRNRYTLEFLGTWEMVHNPRFKVVEFDHFKSEAGLPSFVLSVSEWIEKTDATGIIVKKGKYGGTYAHKDIAFEFGSAISVENPLKVAPLIHSNLTPVKFFHSSILFILVFFVFFLSVMPGSTLNFVYKYNDSFLLLHFRSDSPKSSIRIA